MRHRGSGAGNRVIHGRNIIAIASNWDFDPTSKHHLMSHLAEHNHVLWINYHGSRRPRVSLADLGGGLAKLRQAAGGARMVRPNLTVLTPGVLPLPGSAWARRINQRWVVRAIRRALRALPDQPVQLWSFAPDVDYLVGQFNEELDLYYCVDEFSAFSGYDAETIAALERRLMDRSDVVITTARRLYERKRKLHPNVHLVTHGVDFDHFARSGAASGALPDCLSGVKQPIFGFFGLIQDWVDLDLIGALARRHPEWSFVLIGRRESSEVAEALPGNVHFVGRVPYARLPEYCRVFDVGLIPFKVNRLTRHVNPIKLREYLAAGLPVVSTDLPEARACLPHVLIGGTLEAFEQACVQALQQRGGGHRAARQAAVQDQTWAHKVEELSRLITATPVRGCARPDRAAAPASSTDQ